MIYVPHACIKGLRCGVLIALHGCQQNVDSVGEAFVQGAGLNHWADVYDVVVLYPQTRSGVAANPKACWDWFGYSGANYATRDGVQLRWLVAAVTALGWHWDGTGMAPGLNPQSPVSPFECLGIAARAAVAVFYIAENNASRSSASKRSRVLLPPPSSTARARSDLRTCIAWIFSSTVPLQIKR